MVVKDVEMTGIAPVVYLDSSDYSSLSDPRAPASATALREQLQQLAVSGSARFAYSGVHISEMAPLEPQFAPAAVRRADLLVSLCGRTAFVSFDRLAAMELACLVGARAEPPAALTYDGNWFPNVDYIMPPVDWKPRIHEIDDMARTNRFNREQRRKLKRALFKRNEPTRRAREHMNPGSMDLRELLDRYPMRPHDARVMAMYVVGEVNREEATAAFMNSLRDPQWLMRWFAGHHDKLQTVIDWIRAPSRNMAGQLRESIAKLAELRDSAERFGIASQLRQELSVGSWTASQDQMVVNVARRLAAHFYPESPTSFSASDVDDKCRGVATAIRTVHSAFGASLAAKGSRVPRDSDFADAVHAMYAPYTSFFRADRFMAPHIEKYAGRYGTEVVARLDELPQRIAAVGRETK